MRFARTFDMCEVAAALKRPDIWRTSADDFTGKPADFEPCDDPRIWYVRCFDGDADLGLMMFVPQSTVLFDVHVALNRAAWGRAAVVLRESMAWMFCTSTARRIVGHVPAYNRLAIKCARDAGMELIGINRAAFQRGGMMHDLMLFGVSPD